MKKILVLVSAVVLMAGIAFAVGPQAPFAGKGAGPGSGAFMCGCPMMGGGAYASGQFSQVTDADAKKPLKIM